MILKLNILTCLMLSWIFYRAAVTCCSNFCLCTRVFCCRGLINASIESIKSIKTTMQREPGTLKFGNGICNVKPALCFCAVCSAL